MNLLNGPSIKLITSDRKLTNIQISDYNDQDFTNINGTYEPSLIKTIAEILANAPNFPTSKDSSKWVNIEKNAVIFLDNSTNQLYAATVALVK